MALERVALMAENPSTHARAATATKITANILTVKCPILSSVDTVVTDLLYRYSDDDIPPNRIMKWLHMIFGILYQRYLGESVQSEGPYFQSFIIKKIEKSSNKLKMTLLPSVPQLIILFLGLIARTIYTFYSGIHHIHRDASIWECILCFIWDSLFLPVVSFPTFYLAFLMRNSSTV